MTDPEPDQPGDDSQTPGLEFFTRTTGVTGTVEITLTVNGETYRSKARADLDPEDIGSGLVRLTGASARLLNADTGGQFEELLADLENYLKDAVENAKSVKKDKE